ncbi:helix-turn-helix transcriptional regulator [Longispora sp. NPDC051575]|uniref:helix-turn-helix domain-containing protein n=1 Tax=Longispora sp. NPDC051575 TaxID=3154943 RepID=UPI003419626A
MRKRVVITLAEVVEQQRGERSYDALAKLVGITHQGVNNLGQGRNTEFPKVETLVRLASVLEVTPWGLMCATAQGLGIDMGLTAVPVPRFADRLPPEVAELPDSVRVAMLDLIWSYLDLAQNLPRYEVNTPAPEPVPPTLAAMLQHHLAETGTSYAALAKTAGMTTTPLHNLAQGKNSEFPRVETLRAVSRVIGVPVSEVVAAAAVGLGLWPTGPRSEFARQVPPEVDDLPEETRQSFADVLRLALAALYSGASKTATATRRLRSVPKSD